MSWNFSRFSSGKTLAVELWVYFGAKTIEFAFRSPKGSRISKKIFKKIYEKKLLLHKVKKPSLACLKIALTKTHSGPNDKTIATEIKESPKMCFSPMINDNHSFLSVYCCNSKLI